MKKEGSPISTRRTIVESSREIPVYRQADAVVLGGGPTGIAAAAAAARAGLSTVLVERSGFLGGAGTGGGLSTFCGMFANVHGEHVQTVAGIGNELLERIAGYDGLRAPHLSFADRIQAQAYDIPAYRLAADDLLLEAGVELIFHAFAVGAVMDGDRIGALLIESKEGRMALAGRFFIDGSGDGDLAYWAGAALEHSDAWHVAYPSTMFRINHVDAERAGAAWKTLPAMMDAAVAAGRPPFPRRGAIVRPQRDGIEWRANATQLRAADGSALDGTKLAELSLGEIQGRRQAQQVFSFIKENHPGFEHSYIVDMGPDIGIRETRRLVGAYRLTLDDVLGCADFEDSIGLNGWPVEAHVNGTVDIRWHHGDNPRGYHGLPYRMLVAPEVPNLLVGGRCASMTAGAHSAARVAGPCFAMGQAAGTAAGLALKHNVAASGVPVAALRDSLRAQGAILEVP